MIGGFRSLLVSTCYNYVLIFSLVLLMPCFFLFMCPLSVADAEFEGSFWTARAVNPGHVENCLLLISFRIVCLGGLNAAWWSYLMSADLDVI